MFHSVAITAPNRLTNPFNALVSILIACLISSCALSSRQPGFNDALEEEYALQLMRPASLGKNAIITQRIKVLQENNSYNLRLILHVDADQIQLLLLNNFNQRVATLNFDGETTTSSSNAPLADFNLPNTRTLLQVLQWIYWPAEQIESHWRGSDWNIMETVNTREISRDNQPVARIEYGTEDVFAGEIRFQQVIYGYDLQITSSLTEIEDH